MFWRFGGYAQISAIDTILEKADFTLEELLDESDLIQELKSHNTKLIDYLRQDEILEKLLEYVVAPKLEPVADEEYDVNAGDEEKGKKRDSFVSGMSDDEEEDDKERKRNRYAYVAAEILASDSWSLTESLLANQTLLRKFWEFLSHQPPLDPLQAGYFTKVNEALLDKKTEEMLDLFKSIPHVMEHMLQHVDSPMVMDLLLKIISLEKAEGGQGIVDWLHSQNLIPTLLSFLSEGHSWATQTSAGDFLKAIITISANASQNEQSCIGPNELTRQLVSRPCVERLINDMLKGGNPLTVGVGIVIEVIRKNNSDYDPEVSPDSDQAPSSRDPIYLGTLLRLFADHVPDFMALILSDDHKVAGADGPSTVKRKEITAAFGGKVEPLGFDRFKTCELMAELLHCSNMGLLNERGAEEFVAARDAERERLKAQGKLAVSTERFALDVDDLTMNSGLAGQRDSESPDQQRLSEDTQTISEDDDGFEEITRSQGFTDEEKSDTNTNKDMDDELLDSVKTENYQSFLDKVDDDFVDEPLSSPRLNTDNEPSHAAVDADLGGLASPTREVTAQVEQLNVDTSPPSYDEHTQDTPVTVADDSAKSIDAAEKDVTSGEASSSQPKASEAPPLAPTPDAVISGRPEDTPAPLFADRKESADTQDSAAGVPLPDEGTPGNDSTEMQDSTMVDADGTIQIENGDESMANEEVVVGDYLKRQFVTHSVVPTILVSLPGHA
jgi:SIT4-associating protein SAP185/190